MQNKSKPLVSIVVPCFNSKDLLKSAIDSFLDTKYSNFEINIIDDKSTDGTYELLQKLYQKNKKVNIYQNKSNSGPSKTRNLGINKSKGRYIAFLETDMEVDPNWLNLLVEELEKDSELGAVHSKVCDLNKKNIIQAIGVLFDPHTFWVQNIALGENKSKVQQSRTVCFGSVGTLVRKKVLDKIGGFDEKIVHNIDDVDLGWRTWIAGWKAVSVPESVTYHWTQKPIKSRNKVTPSRRSEFYTHKTARIFIKNYEIHNLIRYLPSLYLMFTIKCLKNLIVDRNANPLFGLIEATIWNIKVLPDTLRERSRIQSSRKFSDNQIISDIGLQGNLFTVFRKYIYASKKKAVENFA